VVREDIMNGVANRLRSIAKLQPPGPRQRTQPPESQPDIVDLERAKAHAERMSKRMRKLHADPEFEKRRIAALRASFKARRAA
jgi:hypothetical protein